ncbi:MAG TPA: hypothetical protein VMG12_14090 [Polyangiaceae bacterium]|nr:hypothetical protein [Polyangiaceae bacterium]
MVLRHRNYNSLLSALTFGTSLTALFLLVRCSVPERDYADLNIGSGAGNGGASGSGNGGTGGTAAGTGGSGGSSGTGGSSSVGGGGGSGGQAGAGPVEPIPCDPIDAGVGDAGSVDAGNDAGANDDCECVEGFIRAKDADGDGDGSRACSVAPGTDCDDNDAAVTHNSCGGCTELPNVIGEDCLECGTYACDGPDAVACAAKPGPVEDPDCRCVAGLITARDTDGDGQGTRLCEANPGPDCNDGNSSFITNACGGCDALPGTVGAQCNQCGIWTCNGTSLECVPATGSGGQRCLNTTTRQTCIGTGFWGNDATCTSVCYQGSCENCIPGTFRCFDIGGGSEQLRICALGTSSSSMSSTLDWRSYDSCTNNTCNSTDGNCSGYLMLPRDRTFDVAPFERGGLPWHDLLNTALEADYG